MRRPDRHNEVELNFIPSGSITYLRGGQKVRLEANHLSAFWAAIPHQIIEFSVDSPYFVATIPLPWFLQCRLPESLVQPVLQGHLVSDPTKQPAFDIELFKHWQRDLAEPKAEFQRAVLLEMEARLLRFALALAPLNQTNDAQRNRTVSLSDGSLNKVEQIACLIAQRYTERLTVEEIGRAVNLHPNYAMSLFQKTFGTTLIEYLTQHRVQHAQRLLATTEQKMVEIAFSSGFNSLSRFNEAFRRACGCAPREYRRLHLLEQVNAAPASRR